jgi:hypothetical protein
VLLQGYWSLGACSRRNSHLLVVGRRPQEEAQRREAGRLPVEEPPQEEARQREAGRRPVEELLQVAVPLRAVEQQPLVVARLQAVERRQAEAPQRAVEPQVAPAEVHGRQVELTRLWLAPWRPAESEPALAVAQL